MLGKTVSNRTRSPVKRNGSPTKKIETPVDPFIKVYRPRNKGVPNQNEN